MSGFFLDWSEIQKSMEKMTENVIPAVTRKGLFAVGAELLRDADRIEPKTPKKEGHLKGSKKIEVAIDQGKISLLAGFNISYASFVHEMVPREEYGEKQISWTEPGSGPKYLQAKLVMFKKKYFAMLGEAIRRGGFNG
jgi:hypothetical protein